MSAIPSIMLAIASAAIIAWPGAQAASTAHPQSRLVVIECSTIRTC
jgi:hypothetical protein